MLERCLGVSVCWGRQRWGYKKERRFREYMRSCCSAETVNIDAE